MYGKNGNDRQVMERKSRWQYAYPLHAISVWPSGACSFRLAVSFASRPCHSFQRSVLAFRYSHSARYALGTACRRSQQKGIPLSLYGPQRSPQSNAMIGELKSAYNRAKSISESRGIINPSEDTTKFTTLLLIFAYIEFRPAQSGLTRIRV